MKPTLVTMLAAAAVLLASTVPHAEATTPAPATVCKRLPDRLDKVTTLLKSISDEDLFGLDLQADKLSTVLQTIDTELPWMSQCLGSIDPLALYAAVVSKRGFTSCSTAVANLVRNVSLPINITDDQSLRERLCPFYGATVVPCVNNIVVRAITDAMNSTGACCDDMKTKIEEQFGTNLQTTVSDQLDKVGAAVCSIKQFQNASGVAKQQACLSSLMETFGGAADNLLLMAQLPTAQACNAMAGLSFMTTSGETVQFNWGTEGIESFGICYEPLSELIELIGGYPLMSLPLTAANGDSPPLTLADMFANGTDKCVMAKDILSIVPDDSVLMDWVHVAKDVFAAVGGLFGLDATDEFWSDLWVKIQDAAGAVNHPMCAHFATGQNCTYSATLKLGYTTPQKSVGSSTTAPQGAVATEGTPSPTTPAPTNANTEADSSATSIFLGVAIALATTAMVVLAL